MLKDTHRETQGHTHENIWELMGIFTQEHTKMIKDIQGHTGNTHTTYSQGLMRTPSQRLTGPHTGTHRRQGFMLTGTHS